MAYATPADATARYGADYVITSCDRDGDGLLDTATFTQALEDASDWIDSYLIGRYDLPLVNAPRRLIKICIDIAIFEMSPDAGTMTTLKADRFKAAQEYLTQVAKGELRLARDGQKSTGANLPGSATIITRKTQKAERVSGSRRYTRDKLDKL